MLGGIVGVTRFVLSALLIPLAGCAASKPATDLTYQDVPAERIADRIFLADAIAAAEGCRPPFSDVIVRRPNFVSPPPAVDGGCGGSVRAAASWEYVDAVSRITALHDVVVREWDVLLRSGPEAAETRATGATLLHCLDRAGFTQRGPGDPSPESYGVGSGDAALNNAAQHCSDETGYGSRTAAQRLRTLKSVLGRHESEINDIVRLKPVLERGMQPSTGAERTRFGLPQ
ncbi:hypothetical protein SAMN04488074_1418 [Lentzea albidocapillata subsp. violacea]|uniref:PknH-like extracellular domain-containing protein n=1 Tax=Lentzea albidocapillata subsp. violacea TaxID=128104 RepID=A0A1G9ZPT3_9PSEU|nr:hypothetical protein SAMN04488074_1418 [Lentzea albidocapillata subsp. violacea]